MAHSADAHHEPGYGDDGQTQTDVPGMSTRPEGAPPSEAVSTNLRTLTSSTESLLHSIAGLSDTQAREPSLLPNWSRGHVLTHIARNAEAMMNLLTWARTGVETPMYPSRDKRNADIEAGSGRSAEELVADVRTTAELLQSQLHDTPATSWDNPIVWGSRNRTALGSEIPHLRRIEVEIHHVDLNLDYTLAHLPEDFVEQMLADVTRDYSADHDKPGVVLVGNDDEGRWMIEPGGPEVSGPPPSLLGWLLGRTEGVGLHSDSPLPTLGAWR
ncbi:MAG: maleylpyruvate isomerase family mycothiol-dependent enzyme [Nocardioidaceae bacterium]